MKTLLHAALVCAGFCGACFAANPSSGYFGIRIVDEDTSRGIPLACATTQNSIRFYTDSAGVIAFNEPGLMDRDVYLNISSPGYVIKPDAFGGAGRNFKTTPGTSATVALKRENIAQRLYRITGGGIYRDTVLLGLKAPIREPVLNGSVLGQDSVLTTLYKGKLFWAWGDTGNPRTAVAHNYKSTCAVSDLPGKGGLDPDVGVNLQYFLKDGFTKPMVTVKRGRLLWLSALVSVLDLKGKEHLLAECSEVEPPMRGTGRCLVEFNDDKKTFDELRVDKIDDVIMAEGYPFRVKRDGNAYLYFQGGSHLVRSKDGYEPMIAKDYEAFTCLRDGSVMTTDPAAMDRDTSGRLVYSWKKNTAPIGRGELDELVKSGAVKPAERYFQLADADTGKPVMWHNGSIYWNDWRKRWVMIINEFLGTSMLGEVWYAEADSPEGPWVYTRKVVTHPKYSFYNAVQHPQFDKNGGRSIFFEGTYTWSFSGAEVPTPRYEYNQLMYKLELDDPRLIIPVPVYGNGDGTFRMGGSAHDLPDLDRIAFYACDKLGNGLVPIVATGGATKPGLKAAAGDSADAVVFYALPADAPDTTTTVKLREYALPDGTLHYVPDGQEPPAGATSKDVAVCRVWRNPVDCVYRK